MKNVIVLFLFIALVATAPAVAQELPHLAVEDIGTPMAAELKGGGYNVVISLIK